MEYLGASSKLTKILNDKRLLTKNFGQDRANKIVARLDEILAASNLTDISHFPPSRLHGLKGERKNEFAVDVGANWRMVFEAYDEADNQTVDEALARTVLIVSIEDYH